MRRQYQVFVAPGQEDQELPVPASPWHEGRCVQLPLEHWHAILDFSRRHDARETEILQTCSFPANGQVDMSPGELDASISYLDQLRRLVEQSPPLVPEVTEQFPEDASSADHGRMIEAVAAVMREARRMEMPFQAYID